MRKRALPMGLASILVALLAVALTLADEGVVSADNGPHTQGAGVTTDSCAGCHRAHTGQAEDILAQAQPGLCYSCHGTGATGSDLDVQDGIFDGTGGPLALRGGGFEFARVKTDDATSSTVGVLAAGQAVNSWHTVDGTSGTMWGNGAIGSGAGSSATLRCGSCHDPHGNGQYRVLRPQPSGAGTSVNVTDAVSKVYSTTNYWNVTYVSNIEMSNWCSNCHTRYLAPDGSPTTDSGDAIFKYRHPSDGNGVPTCIKCHVSHGSNATMGTYSSAVVWPDGSAGTPGVTDTNRGSLLKMNNRGVCQKCHNK